MEFGSRIIKRQPKNDEGRGRVERPCCRKWRVAVIRSFARLRTEVSRGDRRLLLVIEKIAFWRISVAALLVVSAFALVGCVAAQGRRLNATEKMMWSTYPLLTRKGMATGFVVTQPSSQRSGVVPVMITAVHLLDTAGRNALLIGTRSLDASGKPQVALIQLQPAHGGKHLYVRHPRHDLAAFELHIPEEAARDFPLSSFLNRSALAGSEEPPRAGTEVFFLGFPDALPGTAGAFPILRSGRVASYAAGPARSESYFVIDADVYPGDSGGPVFTVGRRGRPVLVGVILRRVGPGQRAFSHLALAIKASVIRETLQLLAAPELRAFPSVSRDSKPKR